MSEFETISILDPDVTIAELAAGNKEGYTNVLEDIQTSLRLLEEYRKHESWDDLDDEGQDMMIEEIIILRQYSKTLERRIARFG